MSNIPLLNLITSKEMSRIIIVFTRYDRVKFGKICKATGIDRGNGYRLINKLVKARLLKRRAGYNGAFYRAPEANEVWLALKVLTKKLK